MEKEMVKNKQVLASLNELMILPTNISSSSTDSSEEDATSHATGGLRRYSAGHTYKWKYGRVDHKGL